MCAPGDPDTAVLSPSLQSTGAGWFLRAFLMSSNLILKSQETCFSNRNGQHSDWKHQVESQVFNLSVLCHSTSYIPSWSLKLKWKLKSYFIGLLWGVKTWCEFLGCPMVKDSTLSLKGFESLVRELWSWVPKKKDIMDVKCIMYCLEYNKCLINVGS